MVGFRSRNLLSIANIRLNFQNIGTRFRPLSLELPKPLFPIAGFPIIHHHIEACKEVSKSKRYPTKYIICPKIWAYKQFNIKTGINIQVKHHPTLYIVTVCDVESYTVVKRSNNSQQCWMSSSELHVQYVAWPHGTIMLRVWQLNGPNMIDQIIAKRTCSVEVRFWWKSNLHWTSIPHHNQHRPTGVFGPTSLDWIIWDDAIFISWH